MVDETFEEVLYEVADHYSKILNDCMDLKAKVLHTYQDAMESKDYNDIQCRLTLLKCDLYTYLDNVVSYVKVSSLSIKNEMKAAKLKEELDDTEGHKKVLSSV
jgi:hypothetical protein